jgi:hypothetical protein
MTTKDKAKELVEKFKFETKKSEIINDIILGDISVIFQHHKAKQCALISVDEILDSVGTNYSVNYWQEVKQEIEQL